MIKFLTKEIILNFHQDQISKYGGLNGIRDQKLLESDLAQGESTYKGKYLHKDIFEMAAAYAFHLCKNHAFIDGNKRIALIAMYSFLFVNSYKINCSQKEAYLLILGIANSDLRKKDVASFLKLNTEKIA